MKKFIILLISCLVAVTYACKPVLIVNGLSDPPEHFIILKNNIQKDPKCPDRNVTIIDVNHSLTSSLPMWTQVDMYKKAMTPHFDANPDGIHVIGYSQGSLLSRAVIQSCPNHPVHTYVSLGGLQMGVGGLPLVETKYFGLELLTANHASKPIHTICYNSIGQNTFSACNYWRDERYLPQYLKECVFLPKINNEIDHEKAKEYKESLIKVKKFVMIVTPNDEAIVPWQSGFFGSKNANNEIIKMENQEIYQNDTLGLKILNEKGSIFWHDFSGVHHGLLPTSADVCACINRYLD